MLAYLRLQLLNKWRGFDPRSFGRADRSKGRTALSLIGFLALFLYLFGMLVWLEVMLFDQFAALGQADAVLAIGLMGSTALTLMMGFFTLAGQLFFGRDTDFISALPLSSRSVLAVKTVLALLSEAGITLLFCAPLVIKLGLLNGAGIGFYVKALIVCAFVPMIPLTLALLLSFALIRVSGLWKRREGVTTVVSFAMMIGIMLLSMGSQSMDEQELQALVLRLLLGRGSITDTVLAHYPPLQWADQAMLGRGWEGLGMLLLFVAVSLATLALAVWALGKGYLKLAVRQGEALRRVNRGHRKDNGKEHARSPFAALLRQELREVITVPAYATNCLTGVVMFPMMILIVVVAMGSQEGITNLTALFAQMIPRDYFLAGAIGLMCLVNGMGMAVSTAVSREGKCHDMRKTYPVDGMTFLMAKIVMGMIFNLMTALATAITLWIVLPTFWLETLLALLAGQLFGFLWCSLALTIDVYHPRLLWKTEMEAVKQNFNGFLSMLMALGLTVVLAGVVYLCLRLGASMGTALWIAVAVLALGDGGAWLLLTRKASATYYLQ